MRSRNGHYAEDGQSALTAMRGERMGQRPWGDSLVHSSRTLTETEYTALRKAFVAEARVVCQLRCLIICILSTGITARFSCYAADKIGVSGCEYNRYLQFDVRLNAMCGITALLRSLQFIPLRIHSIYAHDWTLQSSPMLGVCDGKYECGVGLCTCCLLPLDSSFTNNTFGDKSPTNIHG